MHIFTKPIKVLSFVTAVILSSLTVTAQQKDSTATKGADTSAVAKNAVKGYKITGSITDAVTKKPIAGINISVFDFDAAITDDKGGFTVSVPSYSAVLIVSGPGYQTKELSLKGRKTVTTSLYEDGFSSLYSVANMPFGQAPLNTLNTAVTTINAQGAWETSAETPDSYLQGKVAGLDVIRKSGTPNIGANMFLRGYNSIYATARPLIVVDGVIYDDYNYGVSLIHGHVNNPLENIDVNDIDNITVVKDGASMYGTKGANGVILITTGHTNELATRIDAGVFSGYNFAPKALPTLNPYDYRVYLSEMLKSSGLTDAQIQAEPYMIDNTKSGSYYAYHNNNNWQNLVFKNSWNQNYFLKVSGGDNIAKYTLTMGYGNDGSITQQTSLLKYNTRFNADLNLSKNFTVNANLSFTYNEQNMFDQGVSPKTNPIFISLIKSPFISLHQVDGLGNVSPNLSGLDIFNIGNPVSIVDTAAESSKSYRFFGNVNFKLKINRFLTAQSVIGITYDKVRENYFIPRGGVTPDTVNTAIEYSRLGSQVERFYSLNSDTHITYDRVFNRIHHLIVNAGVRFMDSQSADNSLTGGNSTTDNFHSVGTGALLLQQSSGELGAMRWLNNYLSADYQLLNKYFFSYNMAIDGSSRFGSQIPNALGVRGFDMAVLPSFSAGWLISSEKFMRNIDFIELLKLRGSFGYTGNDDIGDYAARQYYTSQNLVGQYGLVRGNIGNPALQWEVDQKADLGIDASLLHQRLSFTFDAYQDRTTHMIIDEPITAVSGLSYAVTNDGGMQTQGLEASVNGRIFNNNKFKWDLGMSISKYRNKITQLPNNSMTTNYAGATILTQVGLPVGMFYGYKTNGVYTSDAEAAASGISVANPNGSAIPIQPKGGDVRFVDVNGDHVIDSKDLQIIGNPNPDFVGSFTSTITYGRFTWGALFTFSKGNQIYNYNRRQLEMESGFQNQSPDVINRWRVNGQITDVPRVSYGDPIGNSRFSDRWIEDGSYIKLRTTSVTYNVPLKSKSLKYVKVYATGNNLFTLTKYLGYDPETSATESPLTQGIDTGLEPLFKSVQLGIRIGL